MRIYGWRTYINTVIVSKIQLYVFLSYLSYLMLAYKLITFFFPPNSVKELVNTLSYKLFWRVYKGVLKCHNWTTYKLFWKAYKPCKIFQSPITKSVFILLKWKIQRNQSHSNANLIVTYRNSLDFVEGETRNTNPVYILGHFRASSLDITQNVK